MGRGWAVPRRLSQYGKRILAIEGSELPVDRREVGLHNRGCEKEGFTQYGEKLRRAFGGIVIDAHRFVAIEGGAQFLVGSLEVVCPGCPGQARRRRNDDHLRHRRG